jgi:ribosomal protein S18 acetylase RimI-like enzyme
MNATIGYRQNNASAAQIAAHLVRCDADFVPPLSGRVDLDAYAQKIAGKASRFEAWSGDTLVALVAAYCNDRERRSAYITSVSVLRERAGEGIVSRLLRQCVEHAKAQGMKWIELEVAEANAAAIRLYERAGFVAGAVKAPFVSMSMDLESEDARGRQA